MGVNVCVGVGVGVHLWHVHHSPTLLWYTSDLLPEYMHVQKYLGNFSLHVVRDRAVAGRNNRVLARCTAAECCATWYFAYVVGLDIHVLETNLFF
jgi:hypothetical protein